MKVREAYRDVSHYVCKKHYGRPLPGFPPLGPVEDVRSLGCECCDIERCARHEAIETTGPFPFVGSVARKPYTEENPRAHGNVRYVERCRCGALRERLANGMWEELGPWGV